MKSKPYKPGAETFKVQGSFPRRVFVPDPDLSTVKFNGYVAERRFEDGRIVFRAISCAAHWGSPIAETPDLVSAKRELLKHMLHQLEILVTRTKEEIEIHKNTH